MGGQRLEVVMRGITAHDMWDRRLPPKSVGEVEQLLGLAFQLEPHILVLFVARDACDALHEIEHRRWRLPFIVEHSMDDLGGLALGEAARRPSPDATANPASSTAPSNEAKMAA